MNDKPITESSHPVLAGSSPALRRAAKRVIFSASLGGLGGLAVQDEMEQGDAPKRSERSTDRQGSKVARETRARLVVTPETVARRKKSERSTDRQDPKAAKESET